MRANLALPVILPWPRAMSTGNWFWPHSSFTCQSKSMSISCRIPNWSGPMPEPVVSVRFPHRAPAPNASCMSLTLLQALLQVFLGGESDIPCGGDLGHGRTGEVIVPPLLDERVAARLRRQRRGGGARANGGRFCGRRGGRRRGRFGFLHDGLLQRQRISTGMIATA